MITKSDAFAVLGLTETATNKQIHQKYTELAKEFHPDTNPSDSSKMVKINEAYDTLIPKTKVTREKSNTDIVLIESARTDLLNNWSLFEAVRKSEEEKMNAFLRKSNEETDQYIEDLLNSNSLMNRESIIQYFLEHGYRKTGARDMADAIVAVITRFRRENV